MLGFYRKNPTALSSKIASCKLGSGPRWLNRKNLEFPSPRINNKAIIIHGKPHIGTDFPQQELQVNIQTVVHRLTPSPKKKKAFSCDDKLQSTQLRHIYKAWDCRLIQSANNPKCHQSHRNPLASMIMQKEMLNTFEEGQGEMVLLDRQFTVLAFWNLLDTFLEFSFHRNRS